MIGQIVGSTLGGVFGQYLRLAGIFIVFGVVALAVSALLAREGRRFAEQPTTSGRSALDPRGASRRFGDFRRHARIVLAASWSLALEALGAGLLSTR